MAETLTATTDPESRTTLKLVDADVHVTPESATMLNDYMSERWRKHLERFGSRTPALPNYPRTAHGGNRTDAFPDDGTIPGSSLELLREQVLDEYGVDYGIVNYYHPFLRDTPGLAADGARAINDWLVDRWLEPEPRLLGSMVVPWEHPELACAEIESRAGDKCWAQVLMPGEGLDPLGSQRYWPIYEAATAAGLPVGSHSGGYDLHLGAGYPSYYFEEHVGYALAMRRQLLSIVSSGLLEAVPGVRIVLIEGGIAWAVSLRWALDSAWELLRDELPLKRRPSEYLDEMVWWTTQPVEEPADGAQWVKAIEHGHLGDRLLFATDYPHWDFDSPLQALPSALGKPARQRIMAGNAADLYGLPR